MLYEIVMLVINTNYNIAKNLISEIIIYQSCNAYAVFEVRLVVGVCSNAKE